MPANADRDALPIHDDRPRSRKGRRSGPAAANRFSRPAAMRSKRPAALFAPPARTPHPEAAPLFRARIQEAAKERFLADGPDGRPFTAKRAAGCLLLPEPGDLVLCHAQADGQAYVVSVLERTGGRAVLDAGCDLTVRGEKALRFEAETLDVKARQALSMEAPDLSLTGARGRLGFLRLSVLADALDAKLRGLSSVIEDARAMFGGLSLSARMVVRTAETEILRADRLRQLIRERFSVRAGRASIQAQEDVSIDGDKINLG